IGLRIESCGLQCHRVQQTLGDDVAGEGIANVGSGTGGIQASAEGVIDNALLPLRVQSCEKSPWRSAGVGTVNSEKAPACSLTPSNEAKKKVRFLITGPPRWHRSRYAEAASVFHRCGWRKSRWHPERRYGKSRIRRREKRSSPTW